MLSQKGNDIIVIRSPALYIIICLLMSCLSGCASYVAKPLSPSQTASFIEARTLDNPGIKRFLEENQKHEIAPWPPRSWDFSTLTLVALYYHPDLGMARAKWDTAQAGIITAGQRPNPSIAFRPQYDVTPYSGVVPWILDFSLDVPIETAGKRKYRIAQARLLSESARLNVRTVAWQVRSRLRTSLLNLFAADVSITLLERQVDIQEELTTLMEKRLKGGEVSVPDVTQARISLDQARLSLSEARKKSAEARAQVGDALGVTLNALDGIDISLDFFENPFHKIPPADFRRNALLNRPDILGALADYAASESALRIEIAKQYPDLNISPGYLFEEGENKWGLGISLTLPVLNQNQGPIAEAKARRQEAESRFLSVQALVIGDINRSIAGYDGALKKLEEADRLVSEKESQQHSIWRMFNVGETDRFVLLSGEFELLSIKVSRLDTLVQVQQSLGLVEDSLQYPLDPSGSNPVVPEEKLRHE